MKTSAFDTGPWIDPLFGISPSLNIPLTCMIIALHVLNRRDIQNVIGNSAKTTSGFHMTVAAVLTESCALYAVRSILYIWPWGGDSLIVNLFFPVTAETQVRAIFIFSQRTTVATFSDHCHTSGSSYCSPLLNEPPSGGRWRMRLSFPAFDLFALRVEGILRAMMRSLVWGLRR